MVRPRGKGVDAANGCLAKYPFGRLVAIHFKQAAIARASSCGRSNLGDCWEGDIVAQNPIHAMLDDEIHERFVNEAELRLVAYPFL
jgi:hypothetical protein